MAKKRASRDKLLEDALERYKLYVRDRDALKEALRLLKDGPDFWKWNSTRGALVKSSAIRNIRIEIAQQIRVVEQLIKNLEENNHSDISETIEKYKNKDKKKSYKLKNSHITSGYPQLYWGKK